MASILFVLRLLFRFLRFLPVVCWAESASGIALSNAGYVQMHLSLIAQQFSIEAPPICHTCNAFLHKLGYLSSNILFRHYKVIEYLRK